MEFQRKWTQHFRGHAFWKSKEIIISEKIENLIFLRFSNCMSSKVVCPFSLKLHWVELPQGTTDWLSFRFCALFYLKKFHLWTWSDFRFLCYGRSWFLLFSKGMSSKVVWSFLVKLDWNELLQGTSSSCSFSFRTHFYTTLHDLRTWSYIRFLCYWLSLISLLFLDFRRKCVVQDHLECWETQCPKYLSKILRNTMSKVPIISDIESTIFQYNPK